MSSRWKTWVSNFLLVLAILGGALVIALPIHMWKMKVLQNNWEQFHKHHHTLCEHTK